MPSHFNYNAPVLKDIIDEDIYFETGYEVQKWEVAFSTNSQEQDSFCFYAAF